MFVNSTTVLFDSEVRLINSSLSLIQPTKHNLAYTAMSSIVEFFKGTANVLDYIPSIEEG